MDDLEYYKTLQSMVDKAKELKTKIDLTDDHETKTYLSLALESVYKDMRELIKERSM